MPDTKVINLTPHPVDIVTESGVLTIEPTSPPCRIEITRSAAESIDVNGVNVGIFEVSRGTTLDLPPRRNGVQMIVSRMVAEENPDRDDLVFPLDLVRDDNGGVVGCSSFGRISR